VVSDSNTANNKNPVFIFITATFSNQLK